MRITRRSEWTFPAMGTSCHVVVEGGSRGLLDHAQDRIAHLEWLWTRFDDDSEVSRLNRSGRAVVTPETFQLVACGLVGRRLSKGRFDPFMVASIVAAGYDRDFADLEHPEPCDGPAREVRAVTRGGLPAVPRPVREMDRRTRTVALAPGAGVDSGGLGKGLAADLVSQELMDRGAQSCLVNLGGDLRVRGSRDLPWRIAISDEPGAGGDEVAVRLVAGGLATSSLVKRRWLRADGTESHHVLDPKTGMPLTSRWAATTAIAGSGWLAEVLSKSVLQHSDIAASKLLRRCQAGAVCQGWSGSIQQLP